MEQKYPGTFEKCESTSLKTNNAEDILKISRAAGPLIEKTVIEIFTAYYHELLNEPVTYIVPAIWGASKEGRLTVSQQHISQKISPIVEEIINLFEFDGLTGAQKFALLYLVRGLFVSKIIYMIELVKNQRSSRKNTEKEGSFFDPLAETIGSA
ncbi:MAG: hypothetical protein HQK59_09750 [Deltaproteobacteria bacterium]|nr:hypothetical protein [Deltaproteobacteria bacterium]